MGSSSLNTPFGPLVTLASHLICSMRTKHMIEGTATLEPKTFTKFRDEEHLELPLAPMEKVFVVSDDAIAYFTNPVLMNIILSNGFDIDSYNEAVSHLCFNNYKLSKQYSKFLLQNIGVGEY